MIDLTKKDIHDWCETLRRAAMTGAMDAKHGKAPRTGQELLVALGVHGRKGHRYALRHAYMAGRFHIETEDLP